MADGVDLRPLPLRERKAALTRIGSGARDWIALTNGLVGEGCALYRAVVAADIEGIVAKRLSDAYRPNHPRWHKVLNRGYSQRHGAPSGFASAGGDNQSR
jgi:ATP-dependent DNA ligase